MVKFIVGALLLVVSLAFAEEKKTTAVPSTVPSTVPVVAPLTGDEKETLRTDQMDIKDASAAYDKLVADTNQKLLQTQEYQNMKAANAKFNADIDQVFTTRKLVRDKDASICDGFDQRPACTTLVKRGLVLQPVPAAQTTTKEEKK